MEVGSIVIVDLGQPSEKFWGILQRLGPEGITFRGVNLSSFDDWIRGLAKAEATIDPTTMFVPMSRVQRISLDEEIGEVESYRQRFERVVGMTVEEYFDLGFPPSTGDMLPS